MIVTPAPDQPARFRSVTEHCNTNCGKGKRDKVLKVCFNQNVWFSKHKEYISVSTFSISLFL